MGITLLTALIIQGNDVNVYPYQRKSQKWCYEISRMERGNFRQLLTCSTVYDSKESAQQRGDELVKKIKAMDLSAQIKNIEELLGEDEKRVIGSAVAAANAS